MVEDAGALRVRTPEHSMRLWPAVDTPHRFRGLHGWISFLLENGRAQAISYEVDDGLTLEALRVD